MSLEDRQQALVTTFSDIEDWEDRYRKIIELGRQLPSLSEEEKQDKFRVRGCQSQVWLHAAIDEQKKVVYRADSDAMIVRGLIAMLLSVYSEASPEDILKTPPDFIEKIGLKRHLSATRSNGLHSMMQQIFYYAKAFAALSQISH